MKTKLSKVLSLTLVMAMLVSMLSIFNLQASAATKTYSATSTKQITVSTGSSWWSTPSITFKCNADYYCGSPYAPKLTLKIYDHNTRKTTWARVTGCGRSISSTLRLERNKTYTVTVSYLYDASVNKNALQAGGGKSWASGSWYISSTSNLKSYRVN